MHSEKGGWGEKKTKKEERKNTENQKKWKNMSDKSKSMHQ